MSAGGHQRRRRPLAVSMGDPAGIGPEITMRAWLERSDRGIAPFVVFGDKDMLGERARQFGLAVPVVSVGSPSEAFDAFGSALPVLHSRLNVRARPGVADPDNRLAIIGAIEAAVAAVMAGDAAAIVTNPIAKH